MSTLNIDKNTLNRHLHIRKGMMAKVITGSDKGKSGRILDIQYKHQQIKVKVQGVCLQKRHHKQGGIKSQEGFIDYSNVKVDRQSRQLKSSQNQKTTKAEDKKATQNASSDGDV